MRNADLTGIGQAWDCNGLRAAKNGKPHGVIASWLVKGPWHPFWDHWCITVLHLRDIPGLPPAVKDSPDQTHEFMIMSLDPGDKDNRKTYDPDDLPEPLTFLQPLDAVVRFKCDSDAKAADLCRKAVGLIIAGKISPDQDYRSAWKALIEGTANCDKHPETKLQ